MKNTFIEGDRAKSLKTIMHGEMVLAKKGKTYGVISTHFCCRQTIDIGYKHPRALVNKCAQCGRKFKERNIHLPAEHFKRLPDKNGKALDKKLNDMEREFVFLENNG